MAGSNKGKGGAENPEQAEAAAQKPVADAKSQGVTIEYIERHDCLETFADSLGNVSFDGHVLRVDFHVTRMVEGRPGTRRTARRTPVARLALTGPAAGELLSKLQQIGAAIARIRREQEQAAKA
jgi:hypothetical protein